MLPSRAVSRNLADPRPAQTAPDEALVAPLPAPASPGAAAAPPPGAPGAAHAAAPDAVRAAAPAEAPAAAPGAAPRPGPWGRSIVLVGMPGAGKSAIGRRLAARLGLPFLDADTEIENAAGMTVAEIFARYGEAHFRDGERRVISRIAAGPPAVLATGGGAYVDPRTRRALREAGAVTLWLRAPIPVLKRRIAGRSNRPLFIGRDPEEVLRGLMQARYPFYAEADLALDCGEDTPEVTTIRAERALAGWQRPARLPVALSANPYEIVVGSGLLPRAGGLMAAHLPSRRVAIVSDANVAALHLPRLRAGLEEGGFDIRAEVTVPPGEGSKSMAVLERVLERILAAGADRGTAVIALGGGVVGDLAGFAAAVAMRGMPFVQIPTTLLAQVDSSVGGKTGVNLGAGKNLAGAFHQPRIVLADTDTLHTLPARELRAGWGEVAKHGLLQGPLWEWCEACGPAAMAGDPEALRHAVLESCRLKAGVVVEDEFETAPEGGRALLNLGHTFAHALEAECGYDGTLLHGEAVAVGLGLAASLSVRLGHLAQEWPGRVMEHLAAVGLPARLGDLPRGFTAEALMGRMRKDKKARGGAMRFVLLRNAGEAFTTADVPPEAVEALLRDEGAV